MVGNFKNYLSKLQTVFCLSINVKKIPGSKVIIPSGGPPYFSNLFFKNKFINVKKIFLIGITNILFMLSSCSNNPVTVAEDKPGRRDYVWSIDTLDYPYNINYRIWGSSPKDVWAINSGDPGNTIFHFDGNKWTSDGVFRLISPHSIWGFADNNVWIGGANGRIWHYDYNSWTQITKLTKDGHDDIVFDNMWGDSPQDFYAFGVCSDSTGETRNSVIAHFANNTWTMINTDGLQGIVENLYKNKSDQKIYLRVIKWGNGINRDSLLIYEYKQGYYDKIYNGTWDREFLGEITLINGEVYFIMGREIAIRVNNQFQTVFRVDLPNFYEGVWGRTSKDIFLSMTDGLAHYNGIDFEYLYHFNKPRTYNFGAAIFDNEVFFIVFEESTHLNLIYHGKLKVQT